MDCPYPPGHPARAAWLVWLALGGKGKPPPLPHSAFGMSNKAPRPEYRGRGRPGKARDEEE